MAVTEHLGFEFGRNDENFLGKRLQQIAHSKRGKGTTAMACNDDDGVSELPR